VTGDDLDLDLEQRALCPDGACIGVLGDDGRCKVCGAVGDGSVVPIASASRRDAVEARDDRDERSPTSDGGGASDELDDRRLCPDGACIGLIGDDGRCKVCGLAAS